MLDKLAKNAKALLDKEAFVPPTPPMDPMAGGMPPMAPAMGGMPPMDPMAGGMPPMDPAMGGMPPMDPAMMGLPPMDPAMAGAPPMDPMAGGMPPMDPAMLGLPPMDPAAGGAPPEGEPDKSTEALEKLIDVVDRLDKKVDGLEEGIAQIVGDQGIIPREPELDLQEGIPEEDVTPEQEGFTAEAQKVASTQELYESEQAAVRGPLLEQLRAIRKAL